MRGHKHHEEEDDEPKAPTWPAVRDLFAQLIARCSDWEEAQIIALPVDMAAHFHQAYPEANLCMEDLRLALHDLNIPYERNEHNDKFYYLANWR